MRYRNASHVDAGNYHLRRPGLGQGLRFVGYAALAVQPALILGGYAGLLPWLLLGLGLLWGGAWYAAIGATWRGPAVMAMVLAAIFLTCGRLGLL